MRKRLIIYLTIFLLVIIGGFLISLVNKKTYRPESFSTGDVVFNSFFHKYFYEPMPGLKKGDKAPDGAKHFASYSINQDLLNSIKDYKVKKPPDTFRIVTLGDSFTYGLFVNTKDNWPSILESRLNTLKCSNYNKFEVINLAVYGHDTEYVLERYKKRGKKYNPDLVLWMHTDLDRLLEQMMPIYAENVIKNGSKIDTVDWTKSGSYQEWLKARKIVKNRMGASGLLNYQLDKIDQFFKEYNGNVGFIIPPDSVATKSAKVLENVLKKRGNGFFLDKIPEEYIEKGRFSDSHPNEVGHKIFADIIYKYLTKNVIGCKK